MGGIDKVRECCSWSTEGSDPCEICISDCLFAVMDRDRRLTGFLRGQTDNPRAPAGFELSNPWRVCLSTYEGENYVSGVLTSYRLSLNTREKRITSAMTLTLDLYISYATKTSHTPRTSNSLLSPSSSVSWFLREYNTELSRLFRFHHHPIVRNTFAAIIFSTIGASASHPSFPVPAKNGLRSTRMKNPAFASGEYRMLFSYNSNSVNPE